MRYVKGLLILGLLAVTASAETHVHAFGGKTLARTDGIGGYLGGGAFEWNWLYLGADWVELRPSERAQEELGFFEGLFGLGFATDVRSADLSLGGSFRVDERLAIIPVGTAGYTQVRLCASFLSERECASGRTLNYGAGVVTRIMASRKFGFHVGIRYARIYHAMLTVGVAFRP